jgi:uncharacterized protein
MSLPCRSGCGACCVAPSISTPLPGHPSGKPAGERCAQLDASMRCRLFGKPERPVVCGSLQPSAEMCGSDQAHAIRWLEALERATQPSSSARAKA